MEEQLMYEWRLYLAEANHNGDNLTEDPANVRIVMEDFGCWLSNKYMDATRTETN